MITLLLLLGGMGASTGWLITLDPRYEPAMACFVLLATLTGIFADRWAAEYERRNAEAEKRAQEQRQRAERAAAERTKRAELLSGLMHEAIANLNTFKEDPMFGRREKVRCPSVYPRLHHLAIDTAITSAVFLSADDKPLFRLLQSCRNRFSRCNQIVGLIEQASATTPRPEDVQAAIHNDLFAEQGAVTLARQQLVELTQHLRNTYPSEMGMTSAAPPPGAASVPALQGVN